MIAIAHRLVANAQASGEVAVCLDLSHMFDGDDAGRCAVNLAHLLLIPPDDITQALTMMRHSTSRWQHRMADHLIRISASMTPVEE
jgi:RecA/RadA recombinase